MTQQTELMEMQQTEHRGPAKPGFLDRPLVSFMRLNWEAAIWIAIFVVSAALRLWMLDVRAMSHDESLHSLYSYYLYANGNYDHNPMMHGPFRYHVSAFIYFLFGDNDFTARIGPVIFGMGVLWMIFLLRRYIGRTGAIVAGVLAAVSPTILFHSRYIRDDIFMAFFTLVWIYGVFSYLDRRRLRDLGIMVAGMAFGFATMENHFIHGAIIGSFVAGLAIWQVMGARWTFIVAAPIAVGGSAWWVLHEMKQDFWGLIIVGAGLITALVLLLLGMRGHWRQLRIHPAADMAVIMLTLVLPFMAAFLHVFTGGDPQVFTNVADYTSQEMIVRLAIFVTICVLASIGIGVGWFWRPHAGHDEPLPADAEAGAELPAPAPWRPVLHHWALLMGAFWLVQVVFFTTFFTNTVSGLASGVVGSLGYWVAQQGVKRGGQPVYYYALVGWLYEFLPALLSTFAFFNVFYNIGRTEPQHQRKWDPVPEGDLPARCYAPGAQNDCNVNTRLIFIVFVIWWTVGAWIGYTVAGEKMPWLLTHMAVPMCVLGGWWFGNMIRHIDWRGAWRSRTWLLVFAVPALAVVLLTIFAATAPANEETNTARRIVQGLLIILALGGVLFAATYGVVRGGFKQGMRLLGVGLAAALFLLTIRTSFTLNFINYDMATEFLVYAHAGPDVKRALAEIDTISERTVGDRNIVVAYDDESSWPLSWYMRLYPNARFYGSNPNPDAMAAPVIIVGPNNRGKVEPYVARDYVKRTYRLVWWPEMDYFNLTPDRVIGALTDPAQRERLFNIIAFRKYRDTNDLSKWRDLAQWPYRHEFDMYVRRDLAPLIWDLNVLPIATEAVNVPVITADQLRTVAATQVYAASYGGLPLLSPRAVAVGPDGERVIADTGNHRIVVLDRDGGFLDAFGSHCNLGDPANTPCQDPDGAGPLALGDGQFYEPWGVAVDANGDIYVADTWNGRIQVFDSQGNFLRKWGVFATTNGELGDPNALFGPRGMTITLDGSLAVADTGNKRIVVYRPSGELVNQMGGGGVVPGRFEEPTDVKVDPTDGSLLVADAWNQRVQRFSADLQFLAEFPVPGWAGRDVVQKPGLTVTAGGDIYVTDPATFFVIGFDRSGAVRGAFGGSGAELTQFGLPNGIAADLAGGTLVVADGGGNRVMVFPEFE